MIDLTPLANIGVEIVAAILMVLASVGVAKLSGYLGIKKDSEIRGYLNQALSAGILFAKQKAKANTKSAKIKVENEQVAEAANYVLSAVPDALLHFKITPERLADMIRARLYDDQPNAGVNR